MKAVGIWLLDFVYGLACELTSYRFLAGFVVGAWFMAETIQYAFEQMLQ